MTLSWEEACAQISAPGSPFEIVEDEQRQAAVQARSAQPAHACSTLPATVATTSSSSTRTSGCRSPRSSPRSTRSADALVDRYGVAKGDRVAIGMRNYPEWVMSMLAITSIGAVSVSLNAWWTEDELDYALDDCGATVLIADVERIGAAIEPCRRLGVRMLVVRAESPSADDVDQWNDVVVPGPAMPAVDVDPDDDATILYTSGTTGRPKGAVSTHRAIVPSVMAFGCRAAADAARAAADCPPGEPPPARRPPAFILIVPLFHVTGCVPVMLSCVVLEVEARDHVQVGPRAGARADRARAGHQLRRRADAELGPARTRRGSPTSTRRACAASAVAARRRRPSWSSGSPAASRAAGRRSATA